MHEVIEFLLATIQGRIQAVILATAETVPGAKVFSVTLAYSLVLTGLSVWVLSWERSQAQVTKARQHWLVRRCLRIPVRGRLTVACLVVPLLNGFWLSLALTTIWRFDRRLQVPLLVVCNTASYYAYEVLIGPRVIMLGPFLEYVGTANKVLFGLFTFGLLVKYRVVLLTTAHKTQVEAMDYVRTIPEHLRWMGSRLLRLYHRFAWT